MSWQQWQQSTKEIDLCRNCPLDPNCLCQALAALSLQAGHHHVDNCVLDAHHLLETTLAADILPASRWDWVPTLSGGSFKWYLQRMTVAVQQLADRYGSQVCLVGAW